MTTEGLRRLEFKGRLLETEIDKMSVQLIKSSQSLESSKTKRIQLEECWKSVIADLIAQGRQQGPKMQKLYFVNKLKDLQKTSKVLSALRNTESEKLQALNGYCSKINLSKKQLDNCNRQSDILVNQKAEIKEESENESLIVCKYTENVKAEKVNQTDMHNLIDDSSIGSSQSIVANQYFLPDIRPVSSSAYLHCTDKSKARQAKQEIRQALCQNTAHSQIMLENYNSKSTVSYTENAGRSTLLVDYLLEPGRLISIDARYMRDTNITVDITAENKRDRRLLQECRESIEDLTKTKIRLKNV